MKIIVAIIVYNRLHNLQEWIRCWEMCEKVDTELIIVHNFDNNEHRIPFEEACKKSNVLYVPRPNIGMDIGAFQDVCYDRLEGFPKEWDYLLWVTDDTYPMSRDFVSKFIEKIKENTGVICLELSPEVKTHIRTTGFILNKETAGKLKFPADPVLTRDHCYQFEHRLRNSFYEQVIGMGKDVQQVYSNIVQTCMWDTHNRLFLNRWKEHYEKFPL